MDAVSMISSVLDVREGAAANQRQIAVAANAARNEENSVAVLIEALQQTSSYGANGQVSGGAVGTRFAASA